MSSKRINSNPNGVFSRGNKNGIYNKPRRADLTEQEAVQPSMFSTGRTVLVLAIVIGCFGILWPKLFRPLIFGETQAVTNTDEDAIFSDQDIKERGRMGAPHPGMGEGQGKRGSSPPGKQTPPLPVRTIDKEWKGRGGPMPGMRPTMGGPGIQPNQPKGGSTMGVIMPIYTIGIIIFFGYTTMKVMFKNKSTDEDEEEEVANDQVCADKTKYDEDYYNNYIQQFSQTSRVPPPQPQHKDCSSQPKPPSECNSKVEDILEDEEMSESDSELDEDDDDADEEVECNDVIEGIDEERNLPKLSTKPEETKIKKTEITAENSKKEEEGISANEDPRDLEIKLLRARLEQTEKTMERIVAHMGSVTRSLSQHGNIQAFEQQHGKNGCTSNEENNKVKDLMKEEKYV
eukprot:GFUD01009220.1.p1 GENE.GFUD01009220.1~~GFUD01009220.1.p1  ORF type:complete len:401 (+),score=134.06 GFUD01009220.1:94-1296(+)